MVTGRPFITLKSPAKSPFCMGRSLASAFLRPSRSSATIISLHRVDPLALEEHVLGPAQADALRAEG